VKVDDETGSIEIERLVIVHDSGTVLNPLIVDGQVLGGAFQGIAGALFEEFSYSEEGNPLARSFADYLAPTAYDVPYMELTHIEHPSPFTILGSKGCGEGGNILMPSLVAAAVEDALKPFKVKIDNLPLKPEYIWNLISSVRTKTDKA
jgi:CO/xanthine dehydrogenase Mo-binding subunit